jgi:hypothetical protein
LKAVLKASTQPEQNVPTPVQQSTKDDGFQEVRRRKRQSSEESTKVSKKPTVPVPATTPAAVQPAPRDTATRNYFAPLRTADMDTDATTETVTLEEAVPSKTCRPPPIALTSTTNLIQLQKHLKNLVTENFEFRSTRNGTRVITRAMTDFNAVRSHFDKNNLSYFTFPKSDRPIKAVIRHIPIDTPAEDISDGLVTLGFDVVSVKQMSASRRSPAQGTNTVNLPLFLGRRNHKRFSN